jgi:hypothetical protein
MTTVALVAIISLEESVWLEKYIWFELSKSAMPLVEGLCYWGKMAVTL